MANIAPQTFEIAGIMEEASIRVLAEKQPRGVLKYAQRTSVGNTLNIVPTFPRLRRIDVYSLVEEILVLDQEAAKYGTLFGIPINPLGNGYDEVKAKEAKAQLRPKMNEYRAMLAAEHHVEELDEPYWHDIEALLGDGGIIERNFDRLTREKLREAGHYASLSTPPDNAERVCLHFIQDVERIYSIYIVGAYTRFISKEAHPGKLFRDYRRVTTAFAKFLAGVLISLPVAVPIIGLALIQSMTWRIVVTILATCLNFPFYQFMLRLPVPPLTLLCAGLAALYVVFISNNQIISIVHPNGCLGGSPCST